MSLVSVFKKHSSDEWTQGVDFTDKLPASATLSTASVVEARDMLTGTSVSGVVTGVADVSGSVVRVAITGGVDAHDYLITVKGTLNTGEDLVSTFIMQVRDRELQ